MQESNGFRQPLHQALTQEILLAGAPRRLVILNGGMSVLSCVILKNWYVLPFAFFVHVAAIYFTQKDPQFFDCFRRYIRTKNFYST